MYQVNNEDVLKPSTHSNQSYQTEKQVLVMVKKYSSQVFCQQLLQLIDIALIHVFNKQKEKVLAYLDKNHQTDHILSLKFTNTQELEQ